MTIEKMMKKLEKQEKAEQGRKQFYYLPKTERRAYVWTGSTSFPVPLVPAR